MLNRRLLTLVAAGLLLSSAAQAWTWNWNWGGGERVSGDGEVVSEQRDVGAFDGVATQGDFKIVIRQASAARVVVTTDKNLQALVETRVVEGSKGATLEVGLKPGYTIAHRDGPQITIDMPQLRAVSVAGSGEVRIESMKTGAVDASIAGSGDIRFMDLTAERVGLHVSGSGDIVAAGRTPSLGVRIAGSGDVRARALAADEVKVNIAGSGDAQVQANKRLHISVAGSGDVAYVGNAEVSASVAGSGRVSRLPP